MKTPPAISRPADHLVRAATALVLGRINHLGDANFLQKAASNGDTGSGIIFKAATTGQTTANASALVQATVSDFFLSLAPMSAASALIGRAVNLQFAEGRYGLNVPVMVPSTAAGGFVEEGQPIPVEAFLFDRLPVQPKKMGIISTFTRELGNASHAEAIIGLAMRESAALVLDAALFSGAAATAAAPAGLLYGVTPITATAGKTVDSMRTDLANLVAAVATVAGNNIVIIAAPGTATKIAIAASTLPYPVLPTSALAEGTVMAVAANALAFVTDPNPDMNAANDAMLHFEDTAPAQIGTPGNPNVMAAPTQSMFQTACIALRLILWTGWALRGPGAVSVINGVTW